MSLQMTRHCECFVTLGAAKWFLPIMDSFMSLQTTRLCECFVTLGAVKWFLICFVAEFTHSGNVFSKCTFNLHNTKEKLKLTLVLEVNFSFSFHGDATADNLLLSKRHLNNNFFGKNNKFLFMTKNKV